MRHIHVPALQRDVSVLAFGCASLGSRVSPATGRRAIAQALDCGINWFDVAPPYGDGMAEGLLGSSLGSRRKDVVICTKFGISRPSVPLARRLLRPLARQLVSTLPRARVAISRSRETGRRTTIDPDAIETWVHASLGHLKTDYIDVLALHDPITDEAVDERIYAVLAGLRRKGVIRAISIAGSADCIVAAGKAGMKPDIVQFADTPLTGAEQVVRGYDWQPAAPTFVTHGVFGSGTLECLRSLDAARAKRLQEFAARYDIASDCGAAEILARFAFSNNPDGIVLSSMFSEAHIRQNAALADMVPDPMFADEFRRFLNGLEIANG